MTAPPKIGAALQHAAPEENLTDTSKILAYKPTCKPQFPDWPADVPAPKPLRGGLKKDGIAQPPAENDGTALGEKIKYAKVILGMSDWVHQPKLSLRWAAAFIALGTLGWTPKELASYYNIGTRRAQQLIAEAARALSALQSGDAP